MTFEGFEPANTTPVPDILFDELLSELSGAELKVMLYIIRRTLGFKKTTDAISLTQFENGIITQEGKVLDKGCGLKSRETICNALQSLEARGCIKSQKRTASKRDKDVTIYSAHFKGEAMVVGKSDHVPSRKNGLPNVVGKNDYGSRKNPKMVVGKSDPQETVIQDTVKQETEDSFVARATLTSVENDEEQADTLRALQAGRVASGVLPEPLPIATTEPETPQENKVTQANEPPSTPVSAYENHIQVRRQVGHDGITSATFEDIVQAQAAVQVIPPLEQAAMVELSPPVVDKSQAHGDKSSKDTRAAAKRERDEMTQKRIDAVYAALDTFKQEVMDDPETHFQRTKVGNQKITDLLTLNPTAKKLRKVFYDMWNEKDGKTGEYFWRKHMSPQNVCTHYEARLIGLEGKEKKSESPAVTAGYTDYTNSPPIEYRPLRLPGDARRRAM